MGYIGMGGTTHDNRDGVHLIGDDCPNNCYELAIEDAPGKDLQEKAEELSKRADVDSATVTVSRTEGDALDFVYGQT